MEVLDASLVDVPDERGRAGVDAARPTISVFHQFVGGKSGSGPGRLVSRRARQLDAAAHGGGLRAARSQAPARPRASRTAARRRTRARVLLGSSREDRCRDYADYRGRSRARHLPARPARHAPGALSFFGPRGQSPTRRLTAYATSTLPRMPRPRVHRAVVHSGAHPPVRTVSQPRDMIRALRQAAFWRPSERTVPMRGTSSIREGFTVYRGRCSHDGERGGARDPRTVVRGYCFRGRPRSRLPTCTSLRGRRAGGTPVNPIVGNQFRTGATVTFGGHTRLVDRHELRPGSARRSGARPRRALRRRRHESRRTVGSPARGWFADFTDVPQANPFHASVEAIIRDGITSGCGGGNYCANDPGDTRADGGLPAPRRATARHTCLRRRRGRYSSTSPPATSRRTGSSSSTPRASPAAARPRSAARQPAALLPDSSVTRAQMATFLLKIYRRAPATSRRPRRASSPTCPLVDAAGAALPGSRRSRASR